MHCNMEVGMIFCWKNKYLSNDSFENIVYTLSDMLQWHSEQLYAHVKTKKCPTIWSRVPKTMVSELLKLYIIRVKLYTLSIL